jgi:hypothetical protein
MNLVFGCPDYVADAWLIRLIRILPCPLEACGAGTVWFVIVHDYSIVIDSDLVAYIMPCFMDFFFDGFWCHCLQNAI